MEQRNKKAPPSFDFFFNDWVGGTMRLSVAEQGCFLRLLIDQWQNGHIPEKDSQRRAICGISNRDEWAEIWDSIGDKFVEVRAGDLVDFDGEDPDRMVLVNRRMHADRQEKLPAYWHRMEYQKKNGSRGGRPPKKLDQNLDETQTKPTRFLNQNLDETCAEPSDNLDKTHIGRGKREESLEGSNLSENRTRTVCVLEDSTREGDQPTEPPEATPPPTSTHRRSRESQEFFKEDFLPESHRTPEVQAAWRLWLTYVLDRDGRLVGASVDAWAMDAARRDPATAAERLRESVSRLSRGGPFWTESTGSRAGPAPVRDVIAELEAMAVAMESQEKQGLQNAKL